MFRGLLHDVLCGLTLRHEVAVHTHVSQLTVFAILISFDGFMSDWTRLDRGILVPGACSTQTGHGFCVIGSRIFREVWFADFACRCCQKVRWGRAFWLVARESGRDRGEYWPTARTTRGSLGEFMSIEIHPEAAKRFDQLANELLSKVAPEPPLVAVGGEFRPDIYPVFQIPEQDIIGEIQDTKSFFDGSGEEVGRLFSHENRTVGLIGNSFKMFTQLTIRIHAVEGLRDTTSLGFIRDAAFEWLEGKYKNTITESCSGYVLKRVEQEIKDFEIWIPLYRTYLESPISVGRVVFRTITREMMDECEARTLSPIRRRLWPFNWHSPATARQCKAAQQPHSKSVPREPRQSQSPVSRLRARWHCCVFSLQRTGRLS